MTLRSRSDGAFYSNTFQSTPLGRNNLFRAFGISPQPPLLALFPCLCLLGTHTSPLPQSLIPSPSPKASMQLGLLHYCMLLPGLALPRCPKSIINCCVYICSKCTDLNYASNCELIGTSSCKYTSQKWLRAMHRHHGQQTTRIL